MADFNRIIVLVGMMGAGKTRVGGELARLMKLPFVDSDREIERAVGSSIADMFKNHSEQAFRAQERQVIERLLKGKTCVLASGGGAFIQPEVMSIIKSKAISVWLKADIDTLVKRVSRGAHRPILQGGDVRNKLQELIDARYPVYAEADITVVTDGQTPQDTARLIKTGINRLLQQ